MLMSMTFYPVDLESCCHLTHKPLNWSPKNVVNSVIRLSPRNVVEVGLTVVV